MDVSERPLDVLLDEATHDSAHDLHALLGHRLAPRLGKALGDRASLVDVGVVRHPHDQTVLSYRDGRIPRSDATACSQPDGRSG